jgi:uncharacterized protein
VPELVVFDTNVWISGFLWCGAPYRCLLLARAGIVRPVYCMEMLAELSEKLRDPFGFSEDRLASVLYDYKRLSKHVVVNEIRRFVVKDPDDDKFVACALAAKADVIVSSDRHLLSLGRCQDIDIIRPADFLERFTG